VTRWGLGIAVLLIAIPAWGSEPEVEPKKFKWMVFPSIAFDTDDGFGLGARFEIQRVDPDVDPYIASFMFQGYVTFRGYHHHRVKVDLPTLGPERQTRFTAFVAFRAWLNDGYWGIGNGTAREREFAGSYDKDDARRTRYRYQLYQPYVQLNLRKDMAHPFGVFSTLVLQYSHVNTYEGSLLEEHQPGGVQGGFALQLSGGFLIDTRAPEITPDRGVFAEFALRVQPRFPGSTGPFFGPFASVRAYLPLAPPRLVLAWRVMGEWLFGDVPLWEMVRWGGSEPITGVGGWLTVRGMAFGRWRAPGKVVGNLELRIDVIRHKLFKQPFRWQLVPFGDFAVVWGAEDLATDGAPAFPIHPTAGIGIHPIWADAFVGRIDFGVGPDAIREPDGSITQAFNWGIYVAFDHIF